MFNSLFLERLVKLGKISHQQAEAALSKNDEDVASYLLANKILDEISVAKALADYYELEYVDIDGLKIDQQTFDVLPISVIRRYDCIPLKKDRDNLSVAISGGIVQGLESNIEQITGLRVSIKIATPSAISSILERSGLAAKILSDLSSEFKQGNGHDDEIQDDQIDINRIDSEDATITKLVNSIILDALQKRASDIHIEVEENSVFTKYRIDGVLHQAAQPLHVKHHAMIISRLKVMAGMDIAERRIPQDGKFHLSVEGRHIDFRVSVLPSVYGEDIVIRVLDKSALSRNTSLALDDLGLDGHTINKLRKSTSEPYGMILITGPTGSGKTTTLYAALSEVNDGSCKIITIEDPVEYDLKGVVQIQVNEKKQLTFARGLRSILRHDPDKILVGEIRDLETAEIAIQASLTGHLVFSTVHANNVFDVVGRFCHMGVDIHNFISALNCVMAQRLIRTICEECKESDDIGLEYLRFSGIDDEKNKKITWYKGAGCACCGGTGYKGRTAITEFLKFDNTIREMIIARQPAASIYRHALSMGMVTLRESGLKKAIDGKTTLMEVNRVTFIE